MAYLCIKNLMAIFAINFLILLRQSDIFFFSLVHLYVMSPIFVGN